MTFKEHNWKRMGSKGAIIDVEVRDENGSKIGEYKAINESSYWKVIEIIEKKHGYSPSPKESVEEEKEKEGMDWLDPKF